MGEREPGVPLQKLALVWIRFALAHLFDGAVGIPLGRHLTMS